MICILWSQNLLWIIWLDTPISSNSELSEKQDSKAIFNYKTRIKKNSASELSHVCRRTKSGESSSVKQIHDAMKEERRKTPSVKSAKSSYKSSKSFKRSSKSSKWFYIDHPQFLVKYKSKDGKQRANKRAKDRVKNGKASSRYIEDLDQYDVQIVEIDTIDELQAFEEDEDVEFVEESKFPLNTVLLLVNHNLNFEYVIDPDRS